MNSTSTSTSTSTRPKFRNADGTITRYSFICGYVERYGREEYPRATISHEPNGYHVKGFTADRSHFWEIFERVKDARKFTKTAAGTMANCPITTNPRP